MQRSSSHLVKPVSVLIAIAKEPWLCLISIMLALLLLFTPLILLIVLHVESYQEISSDPSSVFADVRLKLKFWWTFRSRPVHAQYKSSLVNKYSQRLKTILYSTTTFKGGKKKNKNKLTQIGHTAKYPKRKTRFSSNTVPNNGAKMLVSLLRVIF